MNVKIKESRDLFNQILPVRLVGIDGQVMLGEIARE